MMLYLCSLLSSMRDCAKPNLAWRLAGAVWIEGALVIPIEPRSYVGGKGLCG